jgi:hypothetical protein
MSLDALIGAWNITMRHVAMAQPVTGQQRYERVLDQAFVMLHWTFDHADFPDALALLDDRTFHYFDVRGVTRIFDFEIGSRGWAMTRRGDDFWQRCAATFVDVNTMEGAGENSHDAGASWQHDFDITYSRATEAAAAWPTWR